MRTTIALDDDLLRRVKEQAARCNRSLSKFVEDALREVLARREQCPPRRRPTLPTVRGGLRPGVDYDRFVELSELSEKIGA